MIPPHPRLKAWLEFCGFLYDAAEISAKALRKKLRPRRRGSYATLRPGAETPMWNLCAQAIRAQLKPHGSKVRLARYLGIPKQRVTEFVTSRQRMPDAELTLQMVYWLSEKINGRDPSM